MPTLLELAGAAYPTERNGTPLIPMEGMSLKPLLVSPSPVFPPTRALFWEHEGDKPARHGGWKAVAPRRGAWELYELAVDRAETHNMAAEHLEKVRDLPALWRTWAEHCGVWYWDDLLQHWQSRAPQ